MQHLGRARVAFSSHIDIGRNADRIDFVHIVVREVSENSAPIWGLPPEQLQRQWVGVVPRHLLRYEIIDSRLLVDLGQLPVVAERIRIPSDTYIRPKLFLEIALSD